MTEEKSINNGYSVCFNSWALDTKIKNELPLLMIISSLSAKSGVCFASNEYLADLFGCSEYSISRKISLLSKEGYIKISYQRRGAEIIKREIRLSKIATDDCQKTQPTIAKNSKENNTSNNNISINNIKKENIKERKYAFEGVIIKLSKKDFDEWKERYKDIDLEFELGMLDLWLQRQNSEKQESWFFAVQSILLKKQKEKSTSEADMRNIRNGIDFRENFNGYMRS